MTPGESVLLNFLHLAVQDRAVRWEVLPINEHDPASPGADVLAEIVSLEHLVIGQPLWLVTGDAAPLVAVSPTHQHVFNLAAAISTDPWVAVASLRYACFAAIHRHKEAA